MPIEFLKVARFFSQCSVVVIGHSVVIGNFSQKSYGGMASCALVNCGNLLRYFNALLNSICMERFCLRCSTDSFLLSELTYDATTMRAQAQSHVFKYADSNQLYFTCQIELCHKNMGLCAGITVHALIIFVLLLSEE